MRVEYNLDRFEKIDGVLDINHTTTIMGVSYQTFFKTYRQDNHLMSSFLLKGTADEPVHEFRIPAIKNQKELAHRMMNIMGWLPLVIIPDLVKRGLLEEGKHTELANEIGKGYISAIALLVLDTSPKSC